MKALSVASLVMSLIALLIAGRLYFAPPPPSLTATSAGTAGPVTPLAKAATAKDLGLSVIVLDPVAGVCTVTSKTESSHGNKGKDSHWLVFSSCTAPVALAFNDFTLNGNAASPFTAPPTFTIAPGFQMIKAHVDPAATLGDYLFNIYVNNVKQLEPDIVIE